MHMKFYKIAIKLQKLGKFTVLVAMATTEKPRRFFYIFSSIKIFSTAIPFIWYFLQKNLMISNNFMR